ncbi:lipoprotein NlpI [uncultured Psychrosphaera sp.]|jgi:lipoprotein NlpI|uniref:lipoprotein NlpI n=1 Tax=uncultured Psychrosphaera sp. TaxID=1403522 RepID=UPI00262BA39C|nr:lipoprotein NlpI [uncultured Psychrosphaera sp.]
MKILLLVVITATSLLAGCATKPKVLGNNEPHVVNRVVITEPLAIDYKSELAIAKLTQIINHVKLDQNKLAQMLYDRGVIYDSLGLRSLAQLDFRRTLELKPDHADAYNFIGIHMTLIGQYTQASEAFDSALEIEPDHSYANLNRGIASYYYGRTGLSIDDLELFFIKDQADPYRAIWLYLAEYKNNQEEAKQRLAGNAIMLDKSKWANQIIELYLGKLDEQNFIDNMGKNIQNSRELVDRLCEGYFYLAKFKLLNNEVEAAKNYFRLVLSTNVHEFVEHKYARLELNELYREDKQKYLEMLSTKP